MDVNFLRRLTALGLSNPRRAVVFYMLLSTTGFSAMNIFVRLAARSLDPVAMVTLRNFVTLAILIPLVSRQRFAIIHTTRLRHHLWRSAIGAIGMISWTYALTVMPMVHATALSFTAPLLATLFAMLVLKEHTTPRHFLALGVGFAGTLIILRPSVSGFEWSSLIVILTTASWAITSLFIKSLSRTEPPLRMVFYMNLFMFLLTLPFSFRDLPMPDAATWGALLGMAFFSVFMHFTMVKAYALVPVVTLMPLDFMRLVSTSLFAYLIFGETSDIFTWIGAAVIIGSVAFIAPRAPDIAAEG